MSVINIPHELSRQDGSEPCGSSNLAERVAEHDDTESCTAIARDGFAVLDQMEVEDDANARRS